MPSSNHRKSDTEDDVPHDVPDLPKLLAALAVGKQSVNALPKNSSRSAGNIESDHDEESGKDEDDDDEFDYHMAFSEFRSLCLESRSELASLLNQSMQSAACFDKIMENYDFDDPALWESAAEACDILSERVDQYIQNVKEGRIGQDGEIISDAVERFGELARNKVKGGLHQILGSLVEMEKPQIKYNFSATVQNSRTEPFVPPLHPDKPFSVDSSFTFEPVPGHGLENRQYGGLSGDHIQSIPDDVIAPFEHYPHPYRAEIEALKYRTWQLTVEDGDNGEHGTSGTLKNTSLSGWKGVWIDNEADLTKLVNRIMQGGENMREIAIDLEAHSFRSFSGFVCLMQLSLRRPKVKRGEMAQISDQENTIETAYDFVIDTLALRNFINGHFASIMANPDIVKVMHGADSDIGWLQRDFGLYVVNLFDTGRACRALPGFARASLAYLLSKYANIDADKKHQLSDWRQRPLPSEMLSYAVSDTMYLLDIYDKIRLELIAHDKGKSSNVSISSVLDASKKVCLIRYDKEPFYPNAYKKLTMHRRGKKSSTNLNEQQDSLLKALYDWRDSIAREEDESIQYVCGNSGLVRIASNCPLTVHALRNCVNPLPPLIEKYTDDIIRMARLSVGKNVESSGNTPSNDLMDYTLASERQKGLISHDSILVSNDYDDTSSNDGGIQYITTHSGHRALTEIEAAVHNLVMKPNISLPGRSKGVDGLGAARAAMNEGEEGSDLKEGCVAKESISAQKTATRIRMSLIGENQNLLGLTKPTNFVCEDEKSSTQNVEPEEGSDEGSDESESDEIPKSMKEIYRMSNKNRRKAKKIAVHFSDDDGDVTEPMDMSMAEEIIARSGPGGKDYFSHAPPKRQCLKSEDHQASNDMGKNDIEFMMDLGWVKNEQEAVEMISEQKKTLDSAEIVNVKEKTQGSDAEVVVERKPKPRRGGKSNSKSSNNVPYDYSKVGAIGVGLSKRLEGNPFFEGVAISTGGALDNPGGKQQKKKASNPRKPPAKKSVYGSGNKTHVYRK